MFSSNNASFLECLAVAEHPNVLSVVHAVFLLQRGSLQPPEQWMDIFFLTKHIFIFQFTLPTNFPLTHFLVLVLLIVKTEKYEAQLSRDMNKEKLDFTPRYSNKHDHLSRFK